jgi:MoxR-like ATPase
MHVACEDVAAVAPAILRHRLILNFAAQSEGVTPDDVVRKIIGAIPKNAKL